MKYAASVRMPGCLDVSIWAEFVLKGEHALDLIQRTVPPTTRRNHRRKRQYSCFPNKTGGIVDDLIVYCLEENKAYMLVVKCEATLKKTELDTPTNDKGVEMHNIPTKPAWRYKAPTLPKNPAAATDMDIIRT